METIKTVGVKELKNNLSAYLKEVQRGVRLLVTDRNVVVAELREPLSSNPVEEKNPLYAQYVREGKIRPALHPKTACSRTFVKLPEGTAQAILDELRNEDGRLP